MLDRTDALVQGLGVLPLATVLYGRLEPAEGGLLFAGRTPGTSPRCCAPPTARCAGSTRTRTRCSGCPPRRPARSTGSCCPPGSTVLLCTDGLVERRDADLDEGMAGLHAVVGALPRGLGAQQTADAVVAGLTGAGDDDVALLVLSVT